MSATIPPLLTGFNHGTDEAMLGDLAGEWDRLRESSRAFHSDAMPWDLWYLTRFDDVFEAFQHHDLFSSRQTNYNVDDSRRWIPAQVDPPDHTPYRTAMNPHFGPAAIKALEPAIRARCEELIEGFVADRQCDFVAQFARRFPTTIFMEIMGLPVSESDTFLGWASELLHNTEATDPDGSKRKDASRTIYRYLAKFIADRRAVPLDDLVSKLIDARAGGEPLSDAELLDIAFLLYVAGMDTVAGVLSYAFQHLADHPAHRRLLREHREMIPSAVEEFLRFFSIAAPARVVRDDTEFAGCPMRSGDRVVLATWPANRDPRRFPDADQLLLDRNPNRHIAFGVGIHRCIGSHLARLELRVAIEQWLLRIPDFAVTPEAVITQHVGGAAGLDLLPLRW